MVALFAACVFNTQAGVIGFSFHFDSGLPYLELAETVTLLFATGDHLDALMAAADNGTLSATTDGICHVMSFSDFVWDAGNRR